MGFSQCIFFHKWRVTECLHLHTVWKTDSGCACWTFFSYKDASDLRSSQSEVPILKPGQIFWTRACLLVLHSLLLTQGKSPASYFCSFSWLQNQTVTGMPQPSTDQAVWEQSERGHLLKPIWGLLILILRGGLSWRGIALVGKTLRTSEHQPPGSVMREVGVSYKPGSWSWKVK